MSKNDIKNINEHMSRYYDKCVSESWYRVRDFVERIIEAVKEHNITSTEIMVSNKKMKYTAAQSAWYEYLSIYPKGTTIGFNEFCEQRLNSDEENLDIN